MLRLTLVFAVWMGSTADALENPGTDYETPLHEAYVLEDAHTLQARTAELLNFLVDMRWGGGLTDADVHTILPPHEITGGFLGRPRGARASGPHNERH